MEEAICVGGFGAAREKVQGFSGKKCNTSERDPVKNGYGDSTGIMAGETSVSISTDCSVSVDAAGLSNPSQNIDEMVDESEEETMAVMIENHPAGPPDSPGDEPMHPDSKDNQADHLRVADARIDSDGQGTTGGGGGEFVNSRDDSGNGDQHGDTTGQPYPVPDSSTERRQSTSLLNGVWSNVVDTDPLISSSVPGSGDEATEQDCVAPTGEQGDEFLVEIGTWDVSDSPGAASDSVEEMEAGGGNGLEREADSPGVESIHVSEAVDGTLTAANEAADVMGQDDPLSPPDVLEVPCVSYSASEAAAEKELASVTQRADPEAGSHSSVVVAGQTGSAADISHCMPVMQTLPVNGDSEIDTVESGGQSPARSDEAGTSRARSEHHVGTPDEEMIAPVEAEGSILLRFDSRAYSVDGADVASAGAEEGEVAASAVSLAPDADQGSSKECAGAENPDGRLEEELELVEGHREEEEEEEEQQGGDEPQLIIANVSSIDSESFEQDDQDSDILFICEASDSANQEVRGDSLKGLQDYTSSEACDKGGRKRRPKIYTPVVICSSSSEDEEEDDDEMDDEVHVSESLPQISSVMGYYQDHDLPQREDSSEPSGTTMSRSRDSGVHVSGVRVVTPISDSIAMPEIKQEQLDTAYEQQCLGSSSSDAVRQSNSGTFPPNQLIQMLTKGASRRKGSPNKNQTMKISYNVSPGSKSSVAANATERKLLPKGTTVGRLLQDMRAEKAESSDLGPGELPSYSSGALVSQLLQVKRAGSSAEDQGAAAEKLPRLQRSRAASQQPATDRAGSGTVTEPSADAGKATGPMTGSAKFAVPSGAPGLVIQPVIGPGQSVGPGGGPGLVLHSVGGPGLVTCSAGGLLMRPAGGVVTRPAGGVFTRPAGGVFTRPAGGLVTRPARGIVMGPSVGAVNVTGPGGGVGLVGPVKFTGPAPPPIYLRPPRAAVAATVASSILRPAASLRPGTVFIPVQSGITMARGITSKAGIVAASETLTLTNGPRMTFVVSKTGQLMRQDSMSTSSIVQSSLATTKKQPIASQVLFQQKNLITIKPVGPPNMPPPIRVVTVTAPQGPTPKASVVKLSGTGLPTEKQQAPVLKDDLVQRILLQEDNIMQKHQSPQHPGHLKFKPSRVLRFKCRGCTDEFVNEVSMLDHLQRQSMLIQFPCKHCRCRYAYKVFYNKCALRAHILSHLDRDASLSAILSDFEFVDVKINPLPVRHVKCWDEVKKREALQKLEKEQVQKQLALKVQLEKQLALKVQLEKQLAPKVQLEKKRQTSLPKSFQIEESVERANHKQQVLGAILKELMKTEKPCPICSMTVKCLPLHFQTGKSGQHEKRCKYCMVTMPSPCAYEAHVWIHEKNKAYVCPECGERILGDRQVFLAHLRNMCLHFSRTSSYKCVQCDTNFASKAKLDEHICNRHAEVYYKCLKCPMAFKSWPNFHSHRRSAHGNEAPHKTICKCPLCDTVFNIMERLKEHMVAHSQLVETSATYSCKECQFVADNRSRLILHMTTDHLAKYDFSAKMCPVCGPDFRTVKQVKMRDHLKEEHPEVLLFHFGHKHNYSFAENRYEAANDGDKVVNHQSASPPASAAAQGGKPGDDDNHEVIDLCDEITDQDEVMSDKELSCLRCQMEFGERSIYERHMAKHRFCERKRARGEIKIILHPLTPSKKAKLDAAQSIIIKEKKAKKFTKQVPLPDPEPDLPCFECQELFYDEAELQEHEQLVHGVQVSHPCHLCSLTFDNTAALKRHTQSTHEGRSKTFPFVCYACLEEKIHKGYLKRNKLEKHLLLAHKIHKNQIDYSRCITQADVKEEKVDNASGGHAVEANPKDEPAGEGNAGEGHAVEADPKDEPAGEGNAGEGHVVEADPKNESAGEGNAGEGTAVEANPKNEPAGEGNAGEGHAVEADPKDEPAGEGNAGEGHAVEANPKDEPAGEGKTVEGTAGEGNTKDEPAGEGTAGEGTIKDNPVGEGNADKVTAGEGNNTKDDPAGEGNAGEVTAGVGDASEDKASVAAGQKKRATAAADADDAEPPAKRLRLDGEDNFVCAKCSYVSGDRTSFLGHISKHRRAKDHEALQCNECGLSFAVRPSLKRHLFMVHKVRDFAKYTAETGVSTELQTEDHDVKLDVSQLEKIIYKARASKLNGELQSKPDRAAAAEDVNEAFECNVCYRVFDDGSSLRTHIRTHGMAFIKSKRRGSVELT